MAVQSLTITAFVKLDTLFHVGVQEFMDAWNNDATFRQRIADYVPEFVHLRFIPDTGSIVVAELDFKIDPTLYPLYLANGDPDPQNPPYPYTFAPKSGAATLMERVLWVPPVTPRIIGEWAFDQYGIKSYTVDGGAPIPLVFQGIPPGNGGSRGGAG